MIETALAWLARGATAVLVLVSVLPLVPKGWWPVRAWEFPRLQIVSACVVAVGLVALAPLSVPESVGLAACLLGVVAWQTPHVLPYTRFRSRQVEGTDEAEVRLLISNLDYRNDRKRDVAGMIREIAPDVLLLVEIDEAWRTGLEDIRSDFAHHVEDVEPLGLGLALWSNLPIRGDTPIRHLVSERRPSIHVDLDTSDGRSIRFVGVHPTPPGLDRRKGEGRYDSRIRDAEIVRVARHVADDADSTWVVAGDFNDVAWSPTTRLFEKISGLGDPRRGRALLNTFHARHPLLRFPLDHVFMSPGCRIASIRRVRAPGSDHFALLVEFRLPEIDRQEPSADAEVQEDAEVLEEAGVEDARSNDEQAT